MIPIKGFKGLYSADREGFIWSHRQSKKMKVFINNSGYECLVLNTGRNPRKFLVHRLVAQTFIPNPEGLREVNHKNSNKLDNSSKNLEWVSSRQNKQHAWNAGLYKHRGINHHLVTLTEEQVREIRELAIAGYPSQKQIGEMYGISQMTVCNIKNGKTWNHINHRDE